MKISFGSFWLVFVLIFLARGNHAEANQSNHDRNVELILSTQNLKQLTATTRASEEKTRRARTCAIQRREKIAPTHCYASIAAGSEAEAQVEILKLDSECRSLARAATRLPVLDAFTSVACREALEKRAQDLAYAESRDALR